MHAQDFYTVNDVKPCLPRGVWISFNTDDGAALTHLLSFLRIHLKLEDTRAAPSENIPVAQNGRHAVPLRELIASLEKFNPETEDLRHDIHIGFRDEHRPVFLAYQSEIEKFRNIMIDSDDMGALKFTNNLWYFYNRVQERYFPKIFH